MAQTTSISHEESAPSTFWQQVFVAMRHLIRPTLGYCLLTLTLPLLFLSLGLGLLYDENAYKIKDFAIASLGHGTPDFLNLLGLAGTAFYPVIASYAGVSLTLLFGFSCCLLQTQKYLRGSGPTDSSYIVKRAFIFTIRYMVWFGLLTAVILALVQVVLPMLTFTAMPMILAPAIALNHEVGIFRALSRALSMRWSEQTPFQFSRYIQACGFGAVCYLVHLMCLGAFYYLVHLDKWVSLPRWQISGAAFTVNYAVVAIVVAILQSLLIWGIAVASCCFVMFYDQGRFIKRSLAESLT